MEDSFQRDQFLIRYKDQVEVYWCDSPAPQLVHDGKSDLACSKPPIEWSPLGTYVVSFHGQGIMLHGGPSFAECGRLPHKDVQRVLFSRNERYALTWNGQSGASAKDAVAVWDVATNHLLRRFACTDPHWPSFAFSANEQFLAVKGSNGIGLCVRRAGLSDRFSLPDFRLQREACFGVPAIAVDTHVFRVSNRLGLADAKTVEETEQQLMKNIPMEDWRDAHHWLIYHGRRVCKAQHPLCEVCTLRNMCKAQKIKDSHAAESDE